MALKQRDPVSGQLTTGHDWNGITELNNPVPKFVIAFIAVTHLYALIAWILLPTWPLGQTYTRGVLGIDQRREVTADIEKANDKRADWTVLITTRSFDTIQADPALMKKAMETAAPLFGQNCQVCHGEKGVGSRGFPRLSDDIWVWGASVEAIAETIRVGINSTHPDTRIAQMPAFGRDEMLNRTQIATLTDYLQTLSGGVIKEDSSEGAVLFQENCAACHAEDARGVEDTGAPNLTDSDWLYGGDAESIRRTLYDGREGVMPAWANRLNEAQIKMLAMYVKSLSGGSL